MIIFLTHDEINGGNTMSKKEKLASIIIVISLFLYVVSAIYLDDSIVTYADITDMSVEERIRYEQLIW